jgi:hypothetical protein
VPFGLSEIGNEDIQIFVEKKRKAALADSFSSPKSNPIVNLNVETKLC